MDRRNALLGISGVLATAALVAAPGRSVLAQTTTTATGQTLGTADYRKRTLDVGTFSKATSQLALSHASHPKLREFAQFEVAEQTTMAQVLTDMANPPPVAIDAQHEAQLKALQGQTGKGFDAAYVQGQIAGHHELLTIQQDFLNGNPGSRDHAHIAMLARTVIMMHLTMLQDLQSALTA